MKPEVDINEAIEDVAETVDDLHTSGEEERASLEAVHALDMKSDSWLSKNIRPIFLIFTCVAYLALLVIDSATAKDIDPDLITVLERWGEFAILFYFGSRAWEKVEKTKVKRAVVESRTERKEKRLEAKLKRKNKGGR